MYTVDRLHSLYCDDDSSDEVRLALTENSGTYRVSAKHCCYHITSFPAHEHCRTQGDLETRLTIPYIPHTHVEVHFLETPSPEVVNISKSSSTKTK